MENLFEIIGAFIREIWPFPLGPILGILGIVLTIIGLYFRGYQYFDLRKRNKAAGRGYRKRWSVERAIRKYLKKADSLHATLPVAGFSTKVRVKIDVEDIYVPLREDVGRIKHLLYPVVNCLGRDRNFWAGHFSGIRHDPKRQSAKVTRILHRFHVHGLIAKIPRSRKWRTTTFGRRVMADAIQVRQLSFPQLLALSA